MGLFGPKWKSTNEQKALSALKEGIFDIDKLIEICCTAPLGSVRLAAFGRLASHGVSTWGRSKSRRDTDLRKAAAGLLEKFQEPEQLIKLIRETEEPVLRYAAALRIPKDSLSLLISELPKFSGDDLIALAEYFGDDAFTLAAVRRMRGWKDKRLTALLNEYAKDKQDEEILALMQEDPYNLTIVSAFFDRIPDDMQKVSKALEMNSTELLERAFRTVRDPAAQKYAGEKLNSMRREEQRAGIARIMSSTNGNFSERDIDQFTDPKDIHEAYLLARESAKKFGIGRKPYEKLLEKLTYPDDIVQALTERKNTVGADGLEQFWGAENSWAWHQLSRLNDKERLLSVAKNAKSQIVRWKACKLAGGHFYPEKGNCCRCEVCGFEDHPAPEGQVSGKAYRCRRCKGLVEAIPFSAGLPHSTVTYPDGSKHTINGYGGLQYNEERFAKKNDLF